MAGNLPVTLTTFETELQAKINTVGAATSIEDIISYYRAGENIPTINNTALTDEVQLRLNAVSSSTTAEEFLTLAASFGKISNANQSDLQSALLAIADIPTNSELTSALSPIATSANVSDSESEILAAVSGAVQFSPSSFSGAKQVPSGQTGELINITSTSGRVRLDYLYLSARTLIESDIELEVDGVILNSGNLSWSGADGDFSVAQSSFTVDSPTQSLCFASDVVGKNIIVRKATGTTSNIIYYSFSEGV